MSQFRSIVAVSSAEKFVDCETDGLFGVERVVQDTSESVRFKVSVIFYKLIYQRIILLKFVVYGRTGSLCKSRVRLARKNRQKLKFKPVHELGKFIPRINGVFLAFENRIPCFFVPVKNLVKRFVTQHIRVLEISVRFVLVRKSAGFCVPFSEKSDKEVFNVLIRIL